MYRIREFGKWSSGSSTVDKLNNGENMETNIFKKVINFIKKFFSNKKDVLLLEEKMYRNNNGVISELKEEREILELQRNYESGKIKEADLTEQQKSKLMNLYDKQIKNLKQEIENYNREFESYKEKIINIRKKLNNQ